MTGISTLRSSYKIQDQINDDVYTPTASKKSAVYQNSIHSKPNSQNTKQLDRGNHQGKQDIARAGGKIEVDDSQSVELDGMTKLQMLRNLRKTGKKSDELLGFET